MEPRIDKKLKDLVKAICPNGRWDQIGEEGARWVYVPQLLDKGLNGKNRILLTVWEEQTVKLHIGLPHKFGKKPYHPKELDRHRVRLLHRYAQLLTKLAGPLKT